jgi:hypothetical protein
MRERLGPYFLIVGTVAVLGLAQSVFAQSGRHRPSRAAGSTPTVGAEPSKTPAEPAQAPAGEERPDEKNVKITSLLVAGQIFHPYAYYESSFLGTALKECVDALKAHPVGVAKAGKMDFPKAKELAKKESEVVVLWLGFETKDDGYGNQYLEYVDYAVLLPQTAKILTQGRIKPGEASPAITSGGVLSLPRRTTRSSPVQADLQMRFIAHEVVNRLTLGGWIN